MRLKTNSDRCGGKEKWGAGFKLTFVSLPDQKKTLIVPAGCRATSRTSLAEILSSRVNLTFIEVTLQPLHVISIKPVHENFCHFPSFQCVVCIMNNHSVECYRSALDTQSGKRGHVPEMKIKNFTPRRPTPSSTSIPPASIDVSLESAAVGLTVE
jgi:hypothetical protein